MGERERGREDSGAPKSLVVLGLVGAAALGAFLLVRACGPSDPDPFGVAATSASAPPDGGSGLGPRCRELSPGQSYVVGPAPATPAPADESLDRDDLLAPFAVVIGRAVAIDGGFAMGVLGDGEGGSIATVLRIDAEAKTGKAVKLSRSRGDLDPPVVVGAPDGSLFVALLEPNASGRSVRVARVAGEEVSWRGELDEGRDESLAVDLALTNDEGLVAWDAADDESSFVSVAAFGTKEGASMGAARRLTKKEVDADSPRLTARPGGFFAAYLVRGRAVRREASAEKGTTLEVPEVDASASAAPADPPKQGATPQKKDAPSDDVDEARGGEPVIATWIEVVALDASGAPTAEPMRVTAAEGHVVTFELATAPDGAALVAWRDDDSPTGAGGGPVRVIRVTMGGVGDPFVVSDDVPTDGTPTLLPGWLGMPTLRGPDLLARLGADGMPADPLVVEPSLGRGEPIAASGSRLLLAEPEAKAMRLRVVECGDAAPLPPKPPEDE